MSNNDLIRRGDVRNAFMQMAKSLVGGGIATFVIDDCNKAVDSVPAINAKPNVHGEWIHDAVCGVTRCSSCKWSIEESFYDPTSNEAYPYCPNCGADMR